MPGTGIGAIAPAIKREGTALKADVLDKLMAVRIERATGLVGRATLRFGDFGFTLSAGDTFALGTKITISEPGAGTLFEGTVTGINLEQYGRTAPELAIVADDAAYKLARGTEVATYLNGTYAEVLQKIARRHGLRAQVDATTLTMEYLLQAGTDLAFLDMVADRLGFAWYIDDGSTLVVTKLKLGALAATLTLGEGLQEFSVRASGLRPTSVSVHGWDPDQQQNVTDKNPATPGSRPPALLSSYSGTTPASKLTDSATAVADRRPLTTNEAKVMAAAFYDDWAAGAVVARGTADVDSAIKPGVTVKVQHAGPASGNYLVTAVEHIYDRRGFVTRFTTGARRPAGLVDTLGPAGPDPGFHMSGLVVGVVTDANDPDTRGRVKVRYTGINGEVESPWARVVALGAGNARGVVFHPEVKDEVLVGVRAQRHPPPGRDRRPVQQEEHAADRTQLRDRRQGRTTAGSPPARITSIELADGDGPEQQHILLLVGTAAHKLRLGADRFDIELAEGKPLTIKRAGPVRSSTPSGDVTIEGNNITIKAKAELKLAGRREATLKGTSQTDGAGRAGPGQGRRDGAASRPGGPLTLKGSDGGDQLMTEFLHGAPTSPDLRPDFVGRGFSWPLGVDHTGSIRLTDDRRRHRPLDPDRAHHRAGRTGHASRVRLPRSGTCCSSRSPRTCSG